MAKQRLVTRPNAPGATATIARQGEGDEDPVDELAAVRDAIRAAQVAVREAERDLHDAVWAARRRRLTWREIGEVLGVSAAGAHSRFRGGFR